MENWTLATNHSGMLLSLSVLAFFSHRSSFLFYTKPFDTKMVKGIDTEQSSRRILDSFFGRYIYVHDLPGKFNVNILKNCSALFIWSKKCDPLSNPGLGLETKDSGEISAEKRLVCDKFNPSSVTG
ncbi:hypothetical protein POM88_047029 [Heracleum sosnowskyi]|uniref:Uncharacterized protein n=1 Tax=Heracleum sosnowskyi TaxID=360622 RepID=A0AAD8H7X6_9APIA|nr:hypothetical protein POM88_047029 [Heracleum sosnowskyi]